MQQQASMSSKIVSALFVALFCLAGLQALLANGSSPGSSAKSTAGASSDELENNNSAQMANSPIRPIYLSRFQRSLVSSGPSQNPLIELVREREYRRQLSNDLPDLLAKAGNDKTLARELLNSLIMHQQSQQLTEQLQQLAGNSDPSLEIITDEARANQLAEGAPSNWQARLAELNESQSAELMAALAPGSRADYLQSNNNGQTIANQLAKRSMKPCNFNAVSCARNPFRTRF